MQVKTFEEIIYKSFPIEEVVTRACPTVRAYYMKGWWRGGGAKIFSPVFVLPQYIKVCKFIFDFANYIKQLISIFLVPSLERFHKISNV